MVFFKVNRIRMPLKQDAEFLGHAILAPKVLVRLGLRETWSRATWALVDTGSPFTLISYELALSVGWRPPSAEPSIELQGMGRKETGWRALMDVSFIPTPSQEPHMGLLLPNSLVLVTRLLEQRDVLIGQHDALERLRFVQRNQPPHWSFELAVPEAPREQG